MGLITVKKKGYVRKGYVRKDGVRVKATKVKPSVFKVKDRGQKGRTPEAGQWYAPKVHMGWRKAQPMETRRRLALKAHGGNILATARALQALANVQSRINPTVAAKARADAKYFFRKLK